MSTKKNRGFTLIELMITIGILAIIASIALPNLNNWIALQRINNRANQVVSLLRFARSEAVRMNKPVIICPVSIRSDGKAHDICSARALNRMGGFAAFTLGSKTNRANGDLYRSDTDTLLNTVVLNQNSINVPFQIRSFNLAGEDDPDHSGVIFIYYPNGTFGKLSAVHSNIYSNTATDIRSNYIRIDLAEPRADAPNRLSNKNRVKVLIEPGGRASVCAPDSTLTACTAR